MKEKVKTTKWETAISDTTAESDAVIRGHAIGDLIEKATFAEAIHLVLYGKLPTKKQLNNFNKLLISSISPPRLDASTLQKIGTKEHRQMTVAAGVLALPDSKDKGLQIIASTPFIVGLIIQGERVLL